MDKTYGASMLSSLPYSSTSSPVEDLDVVSGTRIVLRPLTGEAINATVVDPNVYYYDPAALTFQKSVLEGEGGEEGAEEEIVVVTTPELTLPDTVYDASGTPFKMDSVHAGGRNEVYLEVKPRAVWGSTRGGDGDVIGVLKGRWNSIRDELTSAALSSSSSSYSSQDQLIVFFTVATMAIMIGALSARRLRTRNMLDECMHPDLDDDDLDLDTDSFSAGITRAFGGVRYDKKYDVDTGRSVAGSSTGGTSELFDAASDDFGALMGGGGSASNRRKGVHYYGTNDIGGSGGGVGGLHWRGDMEKFDV